MGLADSIVAYNRRVPKFFNTMYEELIYEEGKL